MAQLVKGGPDLPPELLQAQNEGDLVLFCGAGVSNPAGLPLFKELVDGIYEDLSEERRPIEKRLSRQGAYDLALELLEQRNDGVRRALRNRLTATADRDLKVHRALLDLSEVPGGHRLVTTNFDPLFLKAAPGLCVDTAPALPVPRKHRWASLVHLHGLIDDDDPGARDLILTSSDFGRAYLLDGWAAGFVTELFRNFTVLFIGYSVDDPVMRYLTDAIAAERRQGSSFRQPFAFAGVTNGRGRASEEEAWRSKGVRVLPYGKEWRHRALVQTLVQWAALRRGGFQSRQALALRYASRPPSEWQAEETRLVVWALSEPSGTIARAFADSDPTPAVEWLEVFADSGELPDGAKLLAMPVAQQSTPRELAVPLVGRAPAPLNTESLAPVTYEMGRWLTHHLQERQLLQWALDQGGLLHETFRRQIRQRLKSQPDLEPAYRSIWQVLSSDVYADRLSSWPHDWSSLIDRINEGPWAPIQRAEVLRVLLPVPIFRDATPFRSELRRQLGMSEPLEATDLVTIEIGLSGRFDAESLIQALLHLGPPKSEEVLGDLALPITEVLKEVLDWFQFLDLLEAAPDCTTWAMPSIEPHGQNRHFEGWTWLIDLARQCFLALDGANQELARALVEKWRSLKFPLFRRLTLFAATEGRSVAPDLGSRILTENENAALWSSDTKRECMRYLRKGAFRLPSADLTELVEAILRGPPRSPQGSSTHSSDAAAEQRRRNRAVRDRLLRLAHGGVALPHAARRRLADLAAALGLDLDEENEQEEFAVWMGEDDGGRRYAKGELQALSVEELAALLAETSEDDMERQSKMLAWQGVVVETPAKAVDVLRHLAGRDRWLEDVWRYALNASPDTLQYEDVATLLLEARTAFLAAEISSIGRWVETRAKSLRLEEEELLWQLSDRLVPIALAAPVYELASDPLGAAVNHPAGMLAELALHRISARRPKRGEGFPGAVRRVLDRLGDSPTDAGTAARVLLTAQLRFLHAVDPSWVVEKIVPRLAWSSPEAAPLWRGFFWLGRVDADLLTAIKPMFLDAFRHLGELGAIAANAIRLLTFLSMELPELFTRKELATILRELAPDSLAEVAGALADELGNLGENADAGWKERVGPWFAAHWPSRSDARTPTVAEALAEIPVVTRSQFPQVVEAVLPFLVAIGNPSSLEHRLSESSHPESFPGATLSLLEAVVPAAPPPFTWSQLGGLLDRIEAADSTLAGDLRFRRLRDVAAVATP